MNKKRELESQRRSNQEKKNTIGSFVFGFAFFAIITAISIIRGTQREADGYIFLALIVFFVVFFAIWEKLKKRDNEFAAELNELQKEFYESLPSDTYRRVDLGFSSKNNPGAFEAFLASCRFYAKRRKNDIVVLMVESSKGDIILEDIPFLRFDIEFENVYEEEWLPNEIPDEEAIEATTTE